MERAMATHSSTLAWKIPQTEEPWQATVHGVAKSQTRLSDFTHFFGDGALKQSQAHSRRLGGARPGAPQLAQPCFHPVTSGAEWGWATLRPWGLWGVIPSPP